MKKLLMAAMILFIACSCSDSKVSESSDGDSEYECYPGVLRCNSDSIEKCSQSGIWTEYIDCSKNGMTCLFESCVPSEDGDESEYEDGDIEEEIAGDSEETTETEIPDGDAPEGEDEQSEDEYSEEADVEESESPEESLEDLVWVDYERNIIWQKKLPMEENPQDGFLQMSKDEAKDYCRDLELIGLSDWRLPYINEIRSLIVGCENTGNDGTCPLTSQCIKYATCYSGHEEECAGCQPLDNCYCAANLPCSYVSYFGPIEINKCGSFWTMEDITDGYQECPLFIDFLTGGFVLANSNDYDYVSARCVHVITE